MSEDGMTEHDVEHHDHTHVSPSELAAPADHSHSVAPTAPHLHPHEGHTRGTTAVIAEALRARGAAEPAVDFEGVCAGYFGRDVLDEVTFEVDRGDFVGIIGPNGSGKSTLLKAIAGIHPIECGAAWVLGAEPSDVDKRRIGYVPQAESVNWSFPVTVSDVVLMGRYGRLGLFRRPSASDRAIVDQALAEVGMSPWRDSQIGQLSGGQQQRTFVARALVQEPDLLLLDEPIAGVDAASQHAIFTLLEKRNRAGATIIASTHDLSCVATWFGKVLCLNHHVIAFGPPDEVLTRDTLAATFGSHPLLIGGQEEPRP
jgi:ABC-type Mn2+/Zn2+ transport system ATPase subunit